MRIFAILVTVIFPLLARAEVSAILIGVSDYETGSGIEDLRGPRNDVGLMRDVLRRRGINQITVLADGIDGATRPTRSAILNALAQKAETVSPGDFVYVHFSGHGTQQPDENGDETDGLDEVLLPADAGRADPATGQVQNGLVDDDIGAAVDRIRSRGANVWLVLDSCHAGSGLRGAGARVASRFVDPAVLGIPDVPSTARTETATALDLPVGAGGVMAFYAAQSSELAREVDFGDGQFFGLFTAKLAARLDGSADQSFRQVFQAVLRDMNDTSVPGAARLQTPLWSGDLIDAVVFGDTSTAGLRRFDIVEDGILAGLVPVLEDGTLIGLVAAANDPADAVIGYAQMELTEAAFAFLRPVAAECLPRTDLPCETLGDLPPEARFGQVVARPLDLAIHFAHPVDISTGAALEQDHPARLALLAALQASAEPVMLSEDDFDVGVGWDGQALWFGPRIEITGQPLGRRWMLGDGDLTTVVGEIAKAETLDRLLSTLSAAPSALFASPVDVTARVSPVAPSDLLPPGTDVSPRRECRRAIRQRDPGDEAPLTDGASLKQCDTVTVRATGKDQGARDVNRVHVDAKYCIHNDYVRIEGAANAADIGGTMVLCSNCPDGYSAGEERMFVLVSEAAPNSPALNLTGLIENCGQPPVATRGARSEVVNAFLAGLAQGRLTRGSLGLAGLADIWVDRFRWTVLPKEVAFARAQAEPAK